MNEIQILIRAQFDPDLAKFVASARKEYKDTVTGLMLPKGSPYYRLPMRMGPNLVDAVVSVETLNRHMQQDATAMLESVNRSFTNDFSVQEDSDFPHEQSEEAKQKGYYVLLYKFLQKYSKRDLP